MALFSFKGQWPPAQKKGVKTKLQGGRRVHS